MADNYGVRAILAIPKLTEGQLRLLLALETVSRDGRGWRAVSHKTLASYARISPDTLKRARVQLVARGVIEYRANRGRGHLSTWRMPFIDLALPPGKGGHVADPLLPDLADPEKGGTVAPLSAEAAPPEKGGTDAPLSLPGIGGQVDAPLSEGERGAEAPRKGGHADAVTSANATGAFKDSSALRQTDPTVDSSVEGAAEPVDIAAMTDEELAAWQARTRQPEEEPPPPF